MYIKNVKLSIKQLLCWWFGCKPDYEHPCSVVPNFVVPCKRCGTSDTDYADRVGDTRHNRVMAWLGYWLLRRWWPTRCIDCGRRFGTHDKCDGIPF